MPRQALVIMTDSQRFDMVGCYGNPAMHTPNLDAFARSGARFERAYTCQPVCGPARSAIFTGLYPHSNGSWTNCMPLSANVKTVGQRLRDHGILCGYIGKWHLDGGDYFGMGRCPDGWDEETWYDMRNYLEELTQEERVRSRQAFASDQGVDRSFTFGGRCTDRAIRFMEKHRDEDYLLVVSYDEPHGPHLCPKPYNELFRDYCFPRCENVDDDLNDKPAHYRVWAGGAVPPENITGDGIRLFLGCNAFIDSEIGRVLARAPQGLKLYTSDHGDAMSSHRLFAKGPSMCDEIARIPMMLDWPGVTRAGETYAPPVSHIDITPTLLDYFGVPMPRWVEGVSLRSAFEGKKPLHAQVFTEFARYEQDHDGFGGFQPMRAAFDGRFKLAVHLLSTDELYDLENDPHEMRNLISDPACAAKRNELHDALIGWMNATRDPFRGYYWTRRPWRTDAPKATWDDAGMTRQRENEEYEPRQLDYADGLPIREATRIK